MPPSSFLLDRKTLWNHFSNSVWEAEPLSTFKQRVFTSLLHNSHDTQCYIFLIHSPTQAVIVSLLKLFENNEMMRLGTVLKAEIAHPHSHLRVRKRNKGGALDW